MKRELSKCKGDCGKTRYIVNRRHWLCQECNYIRLHGEGAVEEKRKKAEKLLRGKVTRASKIKGKSAKQRKIDEELSRVYEEIERERPHVCTGCGSTKNLSHSHIIRRSWSQGFVTLKENITYHCLVRQDGSEGCHDRWETTSQRHELNDYEENMAFIKKVDPELYWQMKARERELGL